MTIRLRHILPLLVLLLAACGGSGDGPADPSDSIRIVIPKTSVSGEKNSQFIQVQAKGSWTLSSDASDVKFTPASGNGDREGIAMSWGSNPQETERTITVTGKAGSATTFVKMVQAGKPKEAPKATVTTGAADDLTVSQATLHGSYTDANGEIREAGFEWGMTSELGETLQAQDTPAGASGSFKAELNGLGDGKTYYYRAYVTVQIGDDIRTFHGSVRSFTTVKEGDTPSGGNQAGWFELPVMDFNMSGDYRVSTSDPDLFFAYHMCSGGEKGPTGKTARNYTVAYSGKYHCPVWVAAPRHAMYEKKNTERTDAYRRDPDIPSNIQYSSKDTGGGCNKGHMLGSAERLSSEKTNRDVFYYTNIAPQLSTGFNTGGGGWNILEDWVDKQVCSDTLYVVIGTYFEKFTDAYGNTVSPKTISFGGRNDVSMPTMFYYLLMRTKSGSSGKALKDCSASEIQCAAFVRSHTNDLKGQKVTAKEMMSVSDLEKLTGFTYFPNVPNAPKSSFKASDWGL